jgi:hypothetical protein
MAGVDSCYFPLVVASLIVYCWSFKKHYQDSSSERMASMTTSAEKKSDPKTSSRVPALVAFHMMPAPKGKQPILTPIGAAVAHDDGEGYTLQLNLIPTTGGRILLRVPKAKKAV